MLAIDIEGFEHYDWGHGQPDAALRDKLRGAGAANWQGGLGFKWLHEHFESKVRREARSVYDLNPEQDGEFDLIFNYGLLYHLRHPLLSLDRCRAVCRGAMILETHAVNTLGDLPVSFFYEDDVFRGPTNWCGPTEACVVQWLRSAGFPHVYVAERQRNRSESRLVVAACVDDAYRPMFDAAPALTYCDAAYLGRVREATFAKVEKVPRPTLLQRALRRAFPSAK